MFFGVLTGIFEGDFGFREFSFFIVFEFFIYFLGIWDVLELV